VSYLLDRFLDLPLHRQLWIIAAIVCPLILLW
jgi:hypothetical protein